MNGFIPFMGIFFLLIVEFVPTFNAIGRDHPKEINTENATDVANQQPEILEESYLGLKIYNKKAAHIMAELLAKTTLISNFGNFSGNLNKKANLEKTKFQMLNEHLSTKLGFDKKELKEKFKLDSFFQFLSEANDGQEPAPNQNQHLTYKIFEDKLKLKHEFGLHKVLGTNLELELNKLCQNYKNTDPGNSAVYDEICKRAAHDINKIWNEIKNRWKWHCEEDQNRKINIAEQRKLDTIYLAKNFLYKQIWFKALNFALVAMDICYFRSRLKFWMETKKTRKVANLYKYRSGMTDLEYLAYWLLTMLRQVEPNFNIRDYTDDPYKRLGVEVKDAAVQKEKKIRTAGHDGSGPINFKDWGGSGGGSLSALALGMSGGLF